MINMIIIMVILVVMVVMVVSYWHFVHSKFDNHFRPMGCPLHFSLSSTCLLVFVR